MKQMKRLFYLIAFSTLFSPLDAATYYWVGNGGDWNDYNTHWATSSGGSVFYNQPPTANDDVVFDANSFSLTGQIVDLSSGNFYCRNLSWNSVAFNPEFGDPGNYNAAALKIFGSVNADRSMDFQFNGVLSFESSATGNTISLPVFRPIVNISFNNPLGSWTLMDTLKVGSNGIRMFAGTFNTNNYPVYAGRLTAEIGGLKNIKLAQSKLDIIQWDTWSNHVNDLTVDADSSSLRTSYYQAGKHVNFHKISFYSGPLSACAFTGDSAHYDSVLVDPGVRVDMAGIGSRLEYFKSQQKTDIYTAFSFGYAEFTNELNLDEDNTFDTLALFNSGFSTNFNAGKTQTINYTILTSSDPCAGFISIQSYVPGTAATIYKASGTITIYNATLKDITIAGSVVFNAAGSFDNGNVTGCNFTAPSPRTLYWVGGDGHCGDTSHWSLSSGGPGGECVPGLADSVVFDANSLAFLFTIDSTFACGSFNTSGLAQNMTINNIHGSDIINIYGSFLLSSFINWSYTGNLYFKAFGPNNQLAFGQSSTLPKMRFNGSGSWTLQSDLDVNYLYLDQGTLNTNGQTINAGSITCASSGFPVNLVLDTSSIYCDLWSLAGGLTTVSGAQARLTCGDLNDAGTLTLKSLRAKISSNSINDDVIMQVNNFSADSLICLDNTRMVVTGACQVQNLIADKRYFQATAGTPTIDLGNVHLKHDAEFLCDISADSLFLQNPGHSVNIQNLQADYIGATASVCDPYSDIYSTDLSGHPSVATVTIPSGSVNLNNLSLRGINATGGAVFNANNSLDQGNNTGWNFIGTPSDSTYFWVNGTGDWSNGNHWSYTSGGVPAGCVPSPMSNVVFDQNSFGGNDTVYADIPYISFTDMLWQNLTTQPVLAHAENNSNYNALTIYGNVTLDPHLHIQNRNPFNFSGSGSRTLTTNGVYVTSVSINAIQPYELNLADTLSCEIFSQYSGTFNTYGHPIAALAGSFYFRDTVKLGQSVLRASGVYCSSPPNAFLADSATIYANNIGSNQQQINRVILGQNGFIEGSYYRIKDFTADYDMYFYNTSNLHMDKALFKGVADIRNNNTFGKATFNNNILMNGVNSFDTLFLNNQGYNVEIHVGSNTTINDKLFANSSSGNNIFIHSDVPGTAASLNCNGDTVCLEYISIRDIDANGSSAPIYTGQYSTDISNNTGINFTACILPFSNVWPGDANSDGVVDNFDLLNIGIAYNETGYTRAGADLSWTAQSSQDWNRIFSNFVNIKHADCDGNGTIDYFDTLAVSQNYLLTHTLIHQPNTGDENQRLAGTSLTLAPASLIVNVGQVVSIPVQLGSSASPATDIYGVAYKLNYDNTKVVPGSLNMVYPSSWFTPNGNRLPFSKHFPAMGRLDNAQSRIDLTNATGNGTIAYLNFQVDIAATGTIELDLNDLGATDRNGNPIELNGNTVLLQINGMVDIAHAEQAQEFLLVYPNPSAGNMQVFYSLLSEKPVSVEIYDMLGNKVLTQNAGLRNKGNNTLELQTETLPAGVYQCLFHKGSSTQISRIVKTK
jgi:hypothetical protein